MANNKNHNKRDQLTGPCGRGVAVWLGDQRRQPSRPCLCCAPRPNGHEAPGAPTHRHEQEYEPTALRRHRFVVPANTPIFASDISCDRAGD